MNWIRLAMRSPGKPTVWVALIAGALLFCSGCGSGGSQQSIPSEQTAQSALETALAAWQKGKTPPVQVQESSPPIHLVDTQHKANQKLAAFTVLGKTTGEVQSCYAVRLTLDNPREEVRARYVVLGQDPLWVMRYEDCQKVCHWDHAMPANPAPSNQPTP